MAKAKKREKGGYVVATEGRSALLILGKGGERGGNFFGERKRERRRFSRERGRVRCEQKGRKERSDAIIAD